MGKQSGWTAKDEEILMYEIMEDRRLRNLGIDPDGDPIDIMIAIETKYAELQARRKAEDEQCRCS